MFGMFQHDTKEVQQNYVEVAPTAAAANDDPVAEAEVSGSKDLDSGCKIWELPKLPKLPKLSWSSSSCKSVQASVMVIRILCMT